MTHLVKHAIMTVLEFIQRFRMHIPRTWFEAAVFDTIHYVYYRFTRRGELVVYGVA